MPRSSVRPGKPASRKKRIVDEELERRIYELIQKFPTWGYRRIWAWLKHREKMAVNRKKVYRIMKIRGWFVNNRIKTARPRVKGRRSVTDKINHRWATDVTHIPCGVDGWAHLVAVIDCRDREIIGWELALRGRAKEAERAIEAACIRRFGTLRPTGRTPIIRSDNGLIFQSRRFRRSLRDYRLKQEFITPYTPEQNGVIERFFRSLKEECTWLHNYTCFEEAKRSIRKWIRFYNWERPHQSLGYMSPAKFRAQKVG